MTSCNNSYPSSKTGAVALPLGNPHAKALLCLLAGMVLMVVATSALAADAAAKVLFSHGTVTATNASASYSLHKGDNIQAGDTIVTGNNGRIQMRFSDGGLVSLQPNSRFAVSEYTRPSKGKEGSATFNLIKGGLRTLSGSIGHKDHKSYQLKTDVATLGIRGTQFIVTMHDGVMRVHVGHGEVSLYNKFGQHFFGAGENGMARQGQAPRSSFVVPTFGDHAENGGKGSNANNSGSDNNSGDDAGAAPASSVAGRLPADWLTNADETRDIFNDNGSPSGNTFDFAFAAVTKKPCVNPNSVSIPCGSNPAKSQAYRGQSKGTIIDSAGSIVSTMRVAPNLDWNSIDYNNPGNLPSGSNGIADGDLVWGGDNINSDAFYVYGTPTGSLPQTGTLSYTLIDPTYGAIRSKDQGVGTLNSLSLDIKLNGSNSPEFKITLESTLGSTSSSVKTTNFTQGQWIGSASNPYAAFAFSDRNSGSNNNVVCSVGFKGCNTIYVKGILAGNNASQAGIVFDYNNSDGTNPVDGVASLHR